MPVGRAPAAAEADDAQLLVAGAEAAGVGAGAAGAAGAGVDGGVGSCGGGVFVGSVMWLDASLGVHWVGSVPPPTGDPILTMDRALTSPL